MNTNAAGGAPQSAPAKRHQLNLSKVRPENRQELLKLAALNTQQAQWRDGFVTAIANLTEAYMRRDGMWGVRLKGRTILTDYDNTPEARAERTR